MSSPVKSLPASCYSDPDLFSREQSLIFAQHWSYVAPETELELPGDCLAAEIAARSIILVRGEDNQIRGFYNLCRHRASPLIRDEPVNVERIVCPYHSWCYDLTGNLIAAPGFKESDDFKLNKLGLISIRVECWNGMVFACLDTDAPSLIEWLGDVVDIAKDFAAVDDMDYESRLVNEGDVNWKCYSDNTAEGYHLASVHPGLAASLVSKQTSIRAYERGQFVGFDVTYKGKDGVPESSGFWVYKYPGLLLHFSMNSFNVERVIPLSPTRSRMERSFWFKPEISSIQRNATVASSNIVMDEDLEICLRVQKNLQSGVYETGFLSPEREPGTIFFQQLVADSLKDRRMSNIREYRQY